MNTHLCATGIAGLAVLLAATTATAQTPSTISGQAYPTRPVRLIVPVSAGAGSDFFARTVGQSLSELYKQQVIVDNRPGAGGLIGGTIVATATPDGYTLGLASTSHVVAPLLQLKPPYRPLEDFAPVALLASIPSLLIVAPNVPAKNVQELVALAKSKPGQLNFASVGAGTAAHLSAEIFNRAAGIEVVHVAFKTIVDSYTETLASRVHYLVFVMPSAMPMLRDGKLRALAVTSAARNPALPDVPTMREAGLPAAESDTLFGVVAPAAVPRALIARLHADIVNVLRKPETRERFSVQGAQPAVDTTPDAYAKTLKTEYERYRKLLPEIGLKPQ